MYLYHKGNTTGAELQLKKAVENDKNHVGALADYACLKVRISALRFVSSGTNTCLKSEPSLTMRVIRYE